MNMLCSKTLSKYKICSQIWMRAVGSHQTQENLGTTLRDLLCLRSHAAI